MIRLFPDLDTLSEAAAEIFVGAAAEAAASRGGFRVVLAGGSTPRGLYELLASPSYRSRVDWSRIEFFWGDERPVPSFHEESNFRTAYDALLRRVRVPAERMHWMEAVRDDRETAAREYEERIAASFGVPPPLGPSDRSSAQAPPAAPDPAHPPVSPDAGEPASALEPAIPRFDLVLLGLGADGHTASLFPRTSALRETRRWVVINFVPELDQHRMTMTLPLLSAGRRIVFLVSGEDKAPALRRVLEQPPDQEALPAQLIRPESGELLWLVDTQAASLLSAAGAPD